LVQQGFDITVDEVVTASYATATYLRTLNPRSCWVLLKREGLDEFKGLPMDSENPEYIVVGDYREWFNFENMNKAFRLLSKGAKLIGMIPELVDNSMGDLELNVGSWVQMLEKASGVKATYIGKPHPFAIELTLKSINLPREHIALVGDKVNTDMVGARNAGLHSILVKTGEFDPKDLHGKIKPDFVIDSIRELLKLV
jgi:HAD superfamily hydrolase (TIGR01450 family)